MDTQNEKPQLPTLSSVICTAVACSLIFGIFYAIDSTGGCLKVYPFLEDMNGDRIYSISDLKDQAKWLALLPGELILSWIITGIPGLAQFLELSVFNCHGTFSAVMSIFSWMMIYLLYVILRDEA